MNFWVVIDFLKNSVIFSKSNKEKLEECKHLKYLGVYRSFEL